jgi:hypothetical protein
VGDTLSIWSIQGEIIYIRPLYVGILGKDENGENTGQLFLLPNNTFITQIVKKEELRLTGYKLERLSVRYNIGCMNIDFETFIRELGKYLDNQLPLRNMSQVWNFRSYAGYRYKIAYTSDKDGIICEISYVSRPVKRSKIQEDIFIFLHAFYEGRKWH